MCITLCGFCGKVDVNLWKSKFWLIVTCLGGNRLLSSKCDFIHPLFGIERVGQKIFAAQTPPRKRGFLSTHLTIVGKTSAHLRNSLSSLADAPRCSIWGSVRNKTILERLLLLIYSNSQQDTFFCPARCREMTFTNISFMFGGIKLQVCSKSC